MKNILIIINTYLPGHNSGGPLRTIINLIDLLGDEYNFYVLCENHDFASTVPYKNVKYDEWNKVGKANVWYANPLSIGLINKMSKKMDLVYSCGLFSTSGYKTLIAKKLNKVNKKPIVIAPMGVFSDGAYNQKRTKKKFFVKLFKLFGLFKGVKWSVTSELEANDLKNHLGSNVNYIVAEDPPRNKCPGIGRKNIGANKIIFLSRICPQKNLLGAIKALSKIKSTAVFDIYGPKEDLLYWKKCESELNLLPTFIRWNYCGEVETDNVQRTFQKYNIFLFPSLSENYGHVIFEALSTGCVPIISDTTPWNQLDKRNCGYINCLTDGFEEFANSIDIFLGLPISQRKEIMDNAVELAKEKISESRRNSGYKTLFDSIK